MIDVLLLLALPASGKSEIRRYLESLAPDERLRIFGLGRMVQLDDFPYVHLMRRISEEAREIGAEPPFFADDGPFIDRRDWGTLVALLNEDFAWLVDPPPAEVAPGAWMFDRLERARRLVAADGWFERIDPEARRRVEEAIDDDARALLDETCSRRFEQGDTVVIEFARGMPADTVCPPTPPLGYGYSLAQLSPAILTQAAIVYVRVSPEESRRKNRERSIPGADGSILHHGVPERVMLEDYGADDFLWMMSSGDNVRVEVEGRSYVLPAAVFDNRGDFTSFLREDPADWAEEDMATLRARLAEAVGRFRD